MFQMQQVGKKIVELRKKKNMTQVELADELGISFQAVSNWERGNSMPDISKLPELANVFGVSVDDLLGEKSEFLDSAMRNDIEDYLTNNEVSQKELEESIPILKPDQVETVVEHADFAGMEDVAAFLPYLDDETISVLAQQKLEKGESINSFLPYLEEEEIGKFALQKLKKGESINSMLPYLEDKVLEEIAKNKVEKEESINSMLPYLEDEVLEEIARNKVEKGESIHSMLPYLEDNVIQEIAMTKVEKGESIHSMIPFLEEDFLKKLVLKV